MIKGMDHVGIAVENIDDMVSFFKDTFGANETSRTDYPDLQQISAKVNINGATEFELMQPTGPDGAIGKFMKQSPKGGMHHISIRCDNIEKFVDELEKKGITVVGKSFDRPVKVAFIHPKSAKGLLIELKETSD
jgi:methylmalonyl-CoA/ethylmalonyl-CoA epimerase